MRIVGYAKTVGRFIYATEDELLNCSKCSRAIEYGCSMVVQWSFREGQNSERVFCPSCASVSQAGLQDQVFPAVLVGELPDGFLIVPKKPLDMRVSGDAFTLALSNKGISADCSDALTSYEGIGAQSWEGSAIGADVSHIDAEKDRLISLKDIEPHILRLSHENAAKQEKEGKEEEKPPEAKKRG